MRAARLILLLLALLTAACDQPAPTATSTPIAPRGPTPTAVTIAKPTLPPSAPTLAPTVTIAATPRPIVSAAPGLTVNPALPPGATGWLPTGLRGVALTSVVASADGAVFYAGGDGGLWRSSQFGATWTEQAYNFPIAGLFIDPGAPDIIYAAAPTKCGDRWDDMHVSTDGGINWQVPLSGASTPILVGGRWLVVTCAGAQLWQDAGMHWRVVDYPLVGTTPTSFAIAATASTVYAAYYSTTSMIIRRSDDGGESWVGANVPAAFQPPDGKLMLAVLPGDAQTVFLAAANGLLRSVDSGATWGAVADKLDDAVTALLAVPNGRGAIYAAVRGRGVVRSSNGQSWTTVALVPPVGPISSLAYVASTQAGDTLTPPILLAATGDGVWRVSLATAR